ncbi:RUN domain-containing protein 3B-like isoform X4 [Lethenteron reissneri]|uniref:RUN domain-containing protein 3B-like isoform X4 n=1 Tax=Lethenteron reissneri TaxID=7753 RepID=UPI002AB69D3C|nr:RUN domain-containing protein 3B-like isoform X4 [Lethenteron reissneri]
MGEEPNSGSPSSEGASNEVNNEVNPTVSGTEGGISGASDPDSPGISTAFKDRVPLRRNHVDFWPVIETNDGMAAKGFTVKTLIERSNFEPVDESVEEFINFAAVLEQSLNHNLRGHVTWFGVENTRHFWDYIREACWRVPNNCISSVQSMEQLALSAAKGRAWIRVALMEKRLSEYVSAALREVHITRKFYREGAFLLGEEGVVLAGMLLGLNSIDFSFCLKGDAMKTSKPAAIDYTPYLSFKQSVCSDEDLTTLGSGSGSTSLENEIFSDVCKEEKAWCMKYQKMEKKINVICEQKAYLEELVHLREAQIEDLSIRHQNNLFLMEEMGLTTRVEEQQLQVITRELQQQLAKAKLQDQCSRQDLTNFFTSQCFSPPSWTVENVAMNTMIFQREHTRSLPSLENLSGDSSPFSLHGDTSHSQLDSEANSAANWKQMVCQVGGWGTNSCHKSMAANRKLAAGRWDSTRES